MTTVALLAIVVLVLVNGFFVAAEFALVSARPERMAGPETGVRRLVRRQMGSLDEYLAACQLGITIASLALGAIGEPTIANLIEPALGSRLARRRGRRDRDDRRAADHDGAAHHHRRAGAEELRHRLGRARGGVGAPGRWRSFTAACGRWCAC